MPFIPNTQIKTGSDSDLFYSLAGASAIGDSSISISPSPVAPGSALKLVAIAPFTTNCEIRKIASIAGAVVNLKTAASVADTTISFDGPSKTITYTSSLGVFFPGSKVKVTGSASNNSTFTVASVSLSTLVLTVVEAVVTEAAGASVSLKTELNLAHSSGDVVLFLEAGIVPAEIYGVQADNSTGSASANLTGLQRASNEYYWAWSTSPAGSLGGVRLAPGTIYLNGEWFPEHGMLVQGSTVDGSILKATGITFGSSEVAVVHARRAGEVCQYTNLGATGRLFLRDLLVDGNNISGANGILGSFQQPAAWENVRVINCPGYGVAICDTQQFMLRNIEMTACGVGLRYRSAAFVYCENLNIEQSVTGDFVAELQSGGIACSHNHFVGVHLESALDAGEKSFNVGSGDGWMFKNVFYSNQDNASTLFYFSVTDGLTGVPIFTLEDIRANQPSTTFKVVDDVQRGISRTSTAVNRYIQLLVSGAGTGETSWALELSGKSGGGLADPPIFAQGVRLSGNLYGGSGAPNDANGANGDFYFRTDTPGSANQRLYVKSAGSWTGIL